MPDATITDRLFFALQPDAVTAAAIAALAARLHAQLGLKGKPLAPERLHVTLQFIGAFAGLPQEIVNRACDAAAALTAPQFDVCFDRVMSFSRTDSRRPVVLVGGDSLGPLYDFQKRFKAAMLRADVPDASGMSFTPHITLLNGDRPLAEQRVEPFCWTVREFALVRSLVGRGQHENLARFPLNACPL